MGRAGTVVVDAGREAFVYAMARASWVAAAVGLLGALLAWRYLPARAASAAHASPDAAPGDELELRQAEFAPAYGPIERCDEPDCVPPAPSLNGGPAPSLNGGPAPSLNGGRRWTVRRPGDASRVGQPASASPIGQLRPVPPRPQ